MKEYIERSEVKSKKVYSKERHEYVVSVAEIDWLPAANVTPPELRSRWLPPTTEDRDDGHGERPLPHCENCGRAVEFLDKDSYCPRCGAYMEEYEDEEATQEYDPFRDSWNVSFKRQFPCYQWKISYWADGRITAVISFNGIEAKEDLNMESAEQFVEFWKEGERGIPQGLWELAMKVKEGQRGN